MNQYLLNRRSFLNKSTVTAVALAAASKFGNSIPNPIIEQTLTQTRTVNKPFVSEVEDKSHFYDNDYWDEYLTMVATERFNCFAWSTGQAYIFKPGHFDLPDPYFSFIYPFLVPVRGITVSGLSDMNEIIYK